MPRILLGDDTTPTRPGFTGAINSLSKRFPKPSNAVACAALDAVFQVTDFEAGVRAGMPDIVARSFALPWGILPRMELLACGWVKPGDEFKRATDRTWWSKTYAHPLWEPLKTYAQILDEVAIGIPRAFDEEMARGEPSAISRALISAGENLDAIRKDGSDICAPFFIPARVGVMPVRNDACQARLNLKKAPDLTKPIRDVVSSKPFSLGPWGLLGLFVLFSLVKRR